MLLKTQFIIAKYHLLNFQKQNNHIWFDNIIYQHKYYIIIHKIPNNL